MPDRADRHGAPANANPVAGEILSGMVQLLCERMPLSDDDKDKDKERAWHKHTLSFIEAPAKPLVHLREHFGEALDARRFLRYCKLGRAENPPWRSERDDPGLGAALGKLRAYQLKLPGYERARYKRRVAQPDKTLDYHGYTVMHLTRKLRSMVDGVHESARARVLH